MPSTSTLPAVSVASPPPVPSVAAITTYVDSMMEQRGQLIATIEQDVSNALYTVGQVIAQEVSAFEQQVDRLFGINPSPQNPPPNNPVPQPDSGMGRGNASGLGSGSGATTTAHNAPNQTQNNSTTQTGSGSSSGSGSGSGSSATMTNGDTTVQGGMKAQPMTSGTGSGTFGVGGSGTGSVGTGTGSGYANVSGQVWLDNNGDGYENPGEQGYKGITVDLMDPTTAPWTVVMSTTTNSSGYYSFNNIPVGPDPEAFAITVVLSSTSYVDVYATLRAPNVSQIDGHGDSAVFYLKDGGWREIKAGVVSMDVTASNVDTATGDDPSGPLGNNLVTLRDAVETGDNGGGIGHGISIEPVRFINPSNGDPLSGTINLGAALPDITKSYDIVGPGASILTVQGPGGGTSSTTTTTTTVQSAFVPAPPVFRIFKVAAGVEDCICNLTIKGGSVSGTNGGGIYNAGTLTLDGDTIASNQATANPGGGNGGGIYNAAGATLTLVGSEVDEANTASGYGGGIDNLGTFTSESSEIHGNSAKYGGGTANQLSGAITKLLQNTNVSFNEASYGGGIYNSNGTVSMTKSAQGSVQGNSAASGGGIYVSGGKLTMKAATVFENKATTGDGGGIYIKKGNATLNSAGGIADNTAAFNGGGIFNSSGTLDLTGFMNSPLTIGPGNSAINGGGMYLGAASTTTFNGVTVSGNQLIGNPPMGKGKGVAFEKNATLNGLPAGLNDPDDNGNPVQV
jgi:hypothetical protein